MVFAAASAREERLRLVGLWLVAGVLAFTTVLYSPALHAMWSQSWHRFQRPRLPRESADGLAWVAHDPVDTPEVWTGEVLCAAKVATQTIFREPHSHPLVTAFFALRSHFGSYSWRRFFHPSLSVLMVPAPYGMLGPLWRDPVLGPRRPPTQGRNTITDPEKVPNSSYM